MEAGETRDWLQELAGVGSEAQIRPGEVLESPHPSACYGDRRIKLMLRGSSFFSSPNLVPDDAHCAMVDETDNV